MRGLCFASVVLLLHAAPSIAAEPAAPPVEAEKATGASTAAPECTDKPEVCGRQAFERGVTAYRDGDFESAIREFRAALSFKWHPSIALNLGLAEVKAGLYSAAVREFDAVLASSASDEKLRGQAAAEKERASAEQASIELDTGEGPPPVVRIDGASVNASAPVMVDPGLHHVEIEMPGGSVVRRDVTLAVREHLRLSIDRTREIVVVPRTEPERTKAAPPAPPVPPPPLHHHGVAPVWFFVGAGTTVVVAAVATWSALDTESAFDAYGRDLPRLSQAEANERVHDGHALETRTNVLWGVTGVFALGATALGVFFVDWKPSAESAFAVGPGAVTYRGRF